MNKFRIISVVLFSLFTSACTKASLLAANFPAYFSNQEIQRNVDFGSDYGSKLDVYTPDDDKQNHPVIVFFYGGAWEYGSKDMYRFAAEAFTSRGYTVIIPDYVKYPKVKFPAWQYDAAKAVVWAHNNISKDQPLFIMGHSAGGAIGAFLAADPEYMKKEGGDRKWITAFAGLSGPYDFVPGEPEYQDMFGPPDRYPLMQLHNYIDGKQPPFLMLWGKDDDTVGKINIEHVVTAMKANGGVYEVKYYDGIDHIDIVGALAKLGRSWAPVVDDVDAFFKKHMSDKAD